MKDDLDTMTNNVAVTEGEPRRHLMLSNISTHESLEHTGPINEQVRLIRRNAEMMRHKSHNSSTEGKIGLNDIYVRRDPEESVMIGILWTQKSISVDNSSVDDAYAVAVRPSRSSMSAVVLCASNDFNPMVMLNGILWFKPV
ncbi:hypothetical protein AVEN_1283-1 [Araneus ventricosus]|uniref:Uncharacterized protein n=1 Tax=Araneus ventricosus TaxID=182803 RepID=A0A4Y2S783_ARAVE|nr:hypothetical protein AVEN_1283-1 [Araneus ventricosus]